MIQFANDFFPTVSLCQDAPAFNKYNSLWKLYGNPHLTEFQRDVLVSFLDCGYREYEFIAQFANWMSFSRVFDIGCSSGIQSECFKDFRIDYIGIDGFFEQGRWKKESIHYINQNYPCKLPPIDKEQDLAVSVACLGCIQADWDKQFASLSHDFNHALIYIRDYAIPIAERYWDIKIIQQVMGGLYWVWLQRKISPTAYNFYNLYNLQKKSFSIIA